MTEIWEQLVLKNTDAIDVTRGERIQSLWSGYGEIFRVHLHQAEIPSLVIKHVAAATNKNHPHGWDSNFATARKLRSYKIEKAWYEQWSSQCQPECRVAKCYATCAEEDEYWILLEDLDVSGYPYRNTALNLKDATTCLHWLANFHAQFLNADPVNLWPIGSYWHLDTRPDEYHAMPIGPLRESAGKIDNILNSCRYQSLIHGDAKAANFCFSKNNERVAMVDFQYVGGGCGMKDVAYFIGSCLDESQCTHLAPILLDRYFDALRVACTNSNIDKNALENEWRALYPLAWTDFYRFLSGWMPTHKKIHSYTLEMAAQAFTMLNSTD